MMNLAEYRNQTAGLADYLPWAALVAQGVVLNKDGSFQRTARFRGPDLDSATPAELIGTTARLRQRAPALGLWLGDLRRGATQSGDRLSGQSIFPKPLPALVDLERREQFEAAGVHFESRYYLTFLWMPPAEDASRAESWLYEGRDHSGVNPHELLRGFVDRTDRVLQLFEGLRAGSRVAR